MAKKYIDAEKLKAEIKRRLKNVRDYINGAGMRYKGPKYFKAQGKESAYDALLNTIDSFQQEQPEVDLEKALNGLDNAYFDLDGIAVKGATYYLTVNDLKDIARDFYELGLNVRKKE